MSDKALSSLTAAEVLGANDYIYAIISGNSRKISGADLFQNFSPSIYSTLALADDTADFLTVYDTSASEWKKVLGQNLGFTATGSGATLRALSGKLGDWVSVRDFGATGDGTTADQAAFSAAATAYNTVYVPDGTYRIAANTTLAATTRWIISDDADINPDSGITLTFRGPVESGWAQIFGGSGTVTGIKQVRAEWWGATGDGSTNDRAAIQAAQDSIENSGSSAGEIATLELARVVYALGSTVNFTPNSTFKMRWIGQGSQGSGGTYFKGLASFTGTSVLRIVGNGQTSCDFEWRGFQVVPATAGSGASYGILIGGDATSRLNGGSVAAPLIEDVAVNNFSNSWRLANARQIRFKGVSAWQDTLASSIGFNFISAAATEFTGDFDFDSVQMVASASSASTFQMNTAASGAVVAGIRFNGLAAYYGPGSMVATSGGFIQDIWLNPGCQFDAITSNALVLGAGAGSFLRNVHVLSNYIFGGDSNTSALVNLFTTGGGVATSIFVDKNWFRGYADGCQAVSTNGVDAFSVCGNRLMDFRHSTAAVIAINDGQGFSLNDNLAYQRETSNTFTYLISIDSSSNNFSCIGNNDGAIATSAVISDGTATSVNKLIVGPNQPNTWTGASNNFEGAVLPLVSDGAALGSTSKMWADLFLASGGVINFNNGDVLLTHSANTLTWTGASSGYLFDAVVGPNTDDAAALGTATVSWADLFLASGGVLNWANGNATLTHSSGLLTSNVPITASYFTPSSTTVPTNGMYLPAANTLGWAINSAAELQLTATALSPAVDGGNSLGTTALGWQNLFGNTGFVLNIEGGDWVATHTSGILTVGTGDLRVTNNFTNATSVVTVGGAQTLTNKTLTSPVINTGTIGTSLLPTNDDGAPLGSTSKQFSDLFLASGGVINFNAGDVTVTHAANNLLFAGASSGYTFDAKLYPTSDDGAALGDATHNFSDLFLASGSVINWANSDLTLTHASNLLTLAGGKLRVGGNTYITDLSNTLHGVEMGDAVFQAAGVTLSHPGSPGNIPIFFSSYYDAGWEAYGGTGSMFGASLVFDQTTGAIVWQCSTTAATNGSSFTMAEVFRINQTGNFKIGGQATRGTTEGTNQLVLFNGTSPAGSLSNGVSLYARSGEMYAMDAAGNETIQSPHDSKTNEWIFWSKHTPTGKVLRIDMERMMKAINAHFGWDFVHEFAV